MKISFIIIINTTIKFTLIKMIVIITNIIITIFIIIVIVIIIIIILIIILHTNYRNINIIVICIFFIKFSSYNVWKHVRYPNLISRQPGW